jgi:proteasome accessory factor B
VQRALADRLRVVARYDSVFDGGEIKVVLEPLRLIFMSRGWYLFAHSLAHKQVRTFKLDRMVEVTVTEDHFKPDPEFSEKKYFGAAWRMIPDGKLYSVKLRFSEDVATSVEDVRWHDSQSTTRLEDGRLLFEARVDGLREISSWILGYGDQVEVLAPPELRERVRQKAQRIVAMANALDESESA